MTTELLDQLLSRYCSEYNISWDVCYDRDEFLKYVGEMINIPVYQIKDDINYKIWKFDREEDFYFLYDKKGSRCR